MIADMLAIIDRSPHGAAIPSNGWTTPSLNPKSAAPLLPGCSSQGARFHAAHRLDRQKRVVRAGPVMSAVPGWRDGFVVGVDGIVLPKACFKGQGLGRSLITRPAAPGTR